MSLAPEVMCGSEKSTKVNDYRGFEPQPGEVYHIERVSADIEPNDFFNNFITKRKPAIIQSHLKDLLWKGKLWTNQYLKQKAGDADVLVEKRGDGTDSTFGLAAAKTPMKYGDFITEIIAGNDHLYMTTQDPERFQDDLDSVGMPKSIASEPVKSLKGEYPEIPDIFGNLVPYQVTLWQGLTLRAEGTSSGLHHDYHDNLYVLIRGQKRFRLFPPSACAQMQMAGRMVKIHPNGLIVYQNKEADDDNVVTVREDGVPLAYLAQTEKENAELELEKLEEAYYGLLDSTQKPNEAEVAEVEKLKKQITVCEEQIESAMDKMLEYGVGPEDGADEFEEFQEEDDDDDENDNEEDPDDAEPAIKKSKTDSKTLAKSGADSTDMPDHFSKIVLPTGKDEPDEVFEKCPELKKVGHIFCEIKAGEILYLPASWFHEVTSYSSREDPGETADKDKGHLAFNYWMFPPDNDQFEKPYKDSFWQKRWDSFQTEKEAKPQN